MTTSTEVSNTPAITTKAYSEIVLASIELVKRKEPIEEAQVNQPIVASGQQQQIQELALMRVSWTKVILDTMMATHHTHHQWSKAKWVVAKEEFFRQESWPQIALITSMGVQIPFQS